MKLYEIPKESIIRLSLINEATGNTKEQDCTFNSLDGMYSHISAPDGGTVHLSASTVLELDDGIYKLNKMISKRTKKVGK